MSTNSLISSPGNSTLTPANIGLSNSDNQTSSFSAPSGLSSPATPSQQGDSIQISGQNSNNNSGSLQGAEANMLNELSTLAHTLSQTDAADAGGNSNLFSNLQGQIGKQELAQGLKDGDIGEAKNGLMALQQSSQDSSDAQGNSMGSQVSQLFQKLATDISKMTPQPQLQPDASDNTDNGTADVAQLLMQLLHDLSNAKNPGGTSAASDGGPATQGQAAPLTGAAPGASAPGGGAGTLGAAAPASGDAGAAIGTGASYQQGINAGEASINHLLGTMSSGGTGTGAGAGADAGTSAGGAPTTGTAAGGAGWNSQTESELGSQLASQGYSLVKNAPSSAASDAGSGMGAAPPLGAAPSVGISSGTSASLG